MNIISYVTQQKENAIKEWTKSRKDAQRLSKAEQKAYKGAFEKARIKQVRAEAKKDAEYGGRTKRLVFSALKSVNESLKERKKMRGKINYGSTARPNIWR